ncbi:CMRF35-like molecule 1 isoform 2-T2 [Macrochelys suwanniensis]
MHQQKQPALFLLGVGPSISQQGQALLLGSHVSEAQMAPEHSPGRWGHLVFVRMETVPRVSQSLSLAGCWAVTGPGAVRGPPGGSVAVPCRYREGYERNPKYWCRGGWLCSNGHMVETDGSEAEVTRGRVSIRDNHPQREFTVTVGNLTPADAGTYQCGVHRTGLLDPRDTVELSVSPERSSSATSSATANSSPTSSERSSTADSSTSPPVRSSAATVQPASSSTSKPTSIWTTAEEGKPSFSINQDTTSPVDPNPDIPLQILIPCVLLVLIVFLLAAVMLVRMSKMRKKALSAASVQRDKKINLSNLAVGNNAADDSPEYGVIDSRAATDQTGFYSNVEILPNSVNPDSNYVEIQPPCQGSGESEEVSYATVTISTPDQQPIYANMVKRPKTTRPANPPEETLYSAVKNPSKH